MTLTEVFEYPFTRVDPVLGDHVDPPSLAIYETLLTKGATGQPAPGLADLWSVSPDGLRWTLRLRPGARFHSGAPCDAAAVVAALEQCRWGDGFTRQIWYWDPVDTVTVVSADTLALDLRHPCPRLPVLLWGSHTAIANPAARLAHPDDYGRTVADGTGPFVLADFGEHEVVAARRTGGAVPTQLIRWLSRSEPDARRQLLRDPAVDIIRDVDPGWVDPDDPEWRLVAYHENSQFYLALNWQDPRGFGRVELRQALEAYIDRDELVAVALEGRGDGRRSPIPCADEFAGAYPSAAHPPLPLGLAERQLDDLGCLRGADGLRTQDGRELIVDCVVQDTPVFRRIAELLSTQLSRAGVMLRLRYVTVFEDFYNACAAGPAAFLSKWLWGDAMEATAGFSRSDCDADSGGNWQHARSARLDTAYDAFLRGATATELTHGSAVVQRTFMEELPYLPLCSPMETYAVRRNVTGFEPVPRTLYPHYRQVHKGNRRRDRG